MSDASTAIVKVTPISGCRQEGVPACYLLEIDQARILLDAGGVASFQTEHLTMLKRVVRGLDLILISHGDLPHCGALPQLLAGLDIACPVLVTVPAHHLGLVTLYDAYQSYCQATGSPPNGVTLDDIDTAFERMTMLRYSQSYTVATGNAMGIQVTPIAAGHSLGGAIWRIRKHTEEIFYATDFNHKREAHLDGAALDLVQRPSLLIADAKGGLEVHATRKQRDTELVDTILNSLKAGGTVLLPTDTAARSLELLQVLEAHWTSQRLTYPVLFLCHQSQRVVDLAKGMLEWMSSTLAKVFEQDRSNPFDLRAIQICHSLAEVQAVTGPKVIVATDGALEGGFARVLLPEILSSSPSCVIFTTKAAPNTLAVRILGASKGSKVSISYAEQVPLEGEELQRFRQGEREANERRAAEEAFAQLQRQREDEEEDEDEEEGEEKQGVEGNLRPAGSVNTSAAAAKRLEQEQINSAAALQHFYWTDYRTDWFVNPEALPARINVANSYFYPLIPPDLPREAGGVPVRYQVFPFREPRLTADAYGEPVDSSEFRPRSKNLLALASEAIVPATPLIQAIAPIVEPEISTAPMKWLKIVKEVVIKSTRKFIDMSGISDGRSLKTIYGRIQPRRLLLVGGAPEATDYLLNHFRQTSTHLGRAMEVFAPPLGEIVTVSSALNVMQAILDESLISRLQPQRLGDYELAYVRGVVAIGQESQQGSTVEEDEDETLLLPMAKKELGECKSSIIEPHSDAELGEEISDNNGGGTAKRMVVLTAPQNDVSCFSKSNPILLGDPRLSEIRRIVQSELCLPAVFISGDLICGSGVKRVRVCRGPTGITLEGPLCVEYYAVRRVLYSTTAFLQ